MKYIYLVGLEHSGSTLVSKLISARENGVALGEVGQFLSPKLLQNYQKKWGSSGEAARCSCGQNWTECQFWSEQQYSWGMNTNASKLSRYQLYFEGVRNYYSDEITIIDSSKWLSNLRFIVENIAELPIDLSELSVVHVAKDVRSFVNSMHRKSDRNGGIIRTLKLMNYWQGENRKILDYVNEVGVESQLILYEQYCLDGSYSLSSLNKTHIDHIVLSNKDFLNRNASHVRYDYEWFTNRTIARAYAFHMSAQRLNTQLYKLANSSY